MKHVLITFQLIIWMA